MNQDNKEIQFHASSPILRVHNLLESLDYYVKKLGFSLDWQYEGAMASISRQTANLILCENDQGYIGNWVYIGVSDTERLFEELTAAGAKVMLPPTNYPWALEIHVIDLDGNVLRFGSAPQTERPFSEWIPWYQAV